MYTPVFPWMPDDAAALLTGRAEVYKKRLLVLVLKHSRPGPRARARGNRLGTNTPDSTRVPHTQILGPTSRSRPTLEPCGDPDVDWTTRVTNPGRFPNGWTGSTLLLRVGPRQRETTLAMSTPHVRVLHDRRNRVLPPRSTHPLRPFCFTTNRSVDNFIIGFPLRTHTSPLHTSGT